MTRKSEYALSHIKTRQETLHKKNQDSIMRVKAQNAKEQEQRLQIQLDYEQNQKAKEDRKAKLRSML